MGSGGWWVDWYSVIVSLWNRTWAFTHHSARFFPPSLTHQRLRWSWQRSKTKTSIWSWWMEWKSSRAGTVMQLSVPPCLFSLSAMHFFKFLFYQGHEITMFFSLPVYTVTWWSIWMQRLFSKQSVTSTWRWTGYAPHSFTSEPSKIPHITVRAQNSDRHRNCWGCLY